MAVSATCAIMAVVQTRPNRSVLPPAPRFIKCDCRRVRVTLSAGRSDTMAAPDDREAAGVENRRDFKAGRHPERNASLALGHRFDSPAQRAIGGDQTDRGRDGREHQGLDEQLTDDSRAARTER